MTQGPGRPGRPPHAQPTPAGPRWPQAQAGHGSEPWTLLASPLSGHQVQAGPEDRLSPFPRAPQGLRSHSRGVKRARTLTLGCGLCVVGWGSAWPGFPAAWMLLLGFPPYLLSALAIASRGAHGNMPQGPGACSPAASQGNLLLSPHLTQEAYLLWWSFKPFCSQWSRRP